MKKVITFFGAESKVGTTMLAQSLAEELVQKGQRVLMIFASSEMFDDYIQNSETTKYGIEDLIDLNDIRESDLKPVIAKQSGLHYIKGIMRPLRIKRLTNPKKLLEQIISAASKDYDYIVIDGGHNYQYPLPIGSLMVASKYFFVLTPKARAVSRFQNSHEILLMTIAEFMTDNQEIILNKVNNRDTAYNATQLKDLFNMPVNTVHDVSAASAAEVTNQTLGKTNKTYKKEITLIAENILSEGSEL